MESKPFKPAESLREFYDPASLDEGPKESMPDPYEVPHGSMLEAVLEGERVEYFLPVLPEREQKILMMKYGLGGYEPSTYEEIAREFVLSREWIRQLHNQAVARIGTLVQEHRRRDTQ